MRLAGNPSIADALRWATSAGIDRLDGQLLLLHAVGRPNHDRSWLVTHDDQRLQAPEVGTFEALVARRLAGEPLAYIIGVKEFFGLSFGVSNAVLIPRPDTETVVQWALQTIKALETDASTPHILDLGTGSGAIALAIKSQAPQCLVTAIDASATALAQAARNGQQLGLDVTWRQSDWFQAWTTCCLTSLSATRPTSRPMIRIFVTFATSHFRRSPQEPMGWMTYATSSPTVGHTSAKAVGCCWSTAMTKPNPLLSCSRPQDLRRSVTKQI